MTQNINERLKSEFQRRKDINPRYSLRAFANHLDIGVSVLSKIMNEKLQINHINLKKIAVLLSLTPQEYEEYELKLSGSRGSKITRLDSNERTLQFDEFNLIQDWYNFAILEMLKLQDFEAKEKWISKRLCITEDEAFVALERLVRMELIVQNSDGSFTKTNNFTSIIPQNFSTVGMRNRQKQVLAKAITAIDLIDFDKRDQSSITLSLDSDLLPDVKRKIKKMRRSLANYIIKNSKKRDQVYELSVSFFPWSN